MDIWRIISPFHLFFSIAGSDVPYGSFPWQVEIQIYNYEKGIFEHHCGAAVIGERIVMTAAHCTEVCNSNWNSIIKLFSDFLRQLFFFFGKSSDQISRVAFPLKIKVLNWIASIRFDSITQKYLKLTRNIFSFWFWRRCHSSRTCIWWLEIMIWKSLTCTKGVFASRRLLCIPSSGAKVPTATIFQ